MQSEIDEQKRIKQACVEATQKVTDTLKLLLSICQKQLLLLNPQAAVESDHTTVISYIKRDVRNIINKTGTGIAEEMVNVSLTFKIRNNCSS